MALGPHQYTLHSNAALTAQHQRCCTNTVGESRQFACRPAIGHTQWKLCAKPGWAGCYDSTLSLLSACLPGSLPLLVAGARNLAPHESQNCSLLTCCCRRGSTRQKPRGSPLGLLELRPSHHWCHQKCAAPAALRQRASDGSAGLSGSA